MSTLRVLLSSALLLPAIGCGPHHLRYFDDSERVQAHYELPADAKELRVELPEGALTFETGPPGEIRLEAPVRRASVSEEGLDALKAVDARPKLQPGDHPGEWVLQGPRVPDGLPWPDHRIIMRTLVQVPANVAVVGHTKMGHMAAMQRKADVELETAHGDIRLDHVDGNAVIRTGRGVVLIDGQRGSLDIELGKWHGKRVPNDEPDTMQIFVSELGADGVQIHATSANVQLHVPADASFVMDVETGAGRAANSFDVPVTPMPHREFGNTMRGVVGKGGPPITIVVDFGNVSVRGRKTR